MLKKVMLIFIICYFITVGLLDYQHTQGESTARFLTLNIEDNTPEAFPITFIQPNGHGERQLPKPIEQITGRIQWSKDSKWLYYGGFYTHSYDGSSRSIIQRLSTKYHIPETLATYSRYIHLFPPNNHWVYLNDENYLINKENTVLSEEHTIFEYDWSPDGKWLVYLTRDDEAMGRLAHNLFRVDYYGNTVEKLTDTPVPKTLVAVAPNNEQVAFFSAGENNAYGAIWQVDWAGQRQVLIDKLDIAAALAWSPDGRYLAVTARQINQAGLNLAWIDMNTLTVTHYHSQLSFFDIVWLPDEDTILYYSTNTNNHADIYRFDILTQKNEHIYRVNGTRPYIAMSWSPTVDTKWHPLRLFSGGILMFICLLALSFSQRLGKHNE